MSYVLFIHLIFQHLTAESINCKKFGSYCMACNESSCTDCWITTALDTDEESSTYGHCIICKANCMICESETKCKLCLLNFGLDENGDCKTCDDPNCYNCCANSSKCVECDDGYGFDQDKDSATYGKCLKSIEPHCTVYNKGDYTKCTMCAGGYYLNYTSGQCQPAVCTENCSKCTNLYNCEDCKEGFGEGRGGRCQQCKDDYCGKCYITSNFEKCYSCKNGLYQAGYYNPTTNTGSIECYDGIMNCTLYESADKCRKCVDGNGLDEEYKCKPCQDENCKYCVEDYKICTSCLQGFGFDSSNQICTKCKDENCLFCYDDYSKCDSCRSSYKYDTEDYTCHEHCFDSNWENCYYYKKCTQCKEGFKLTDSKCTKCEIENCISCSTNTSSCEKCKDGFKVSGSKCIECPGHCGNCDTSDDPIDCTQCAVNYGFMLEKNSDDFGKCIKCKDQYCQHCIGHPDHCNKCMDGYKFINNKCSTQPSGDDGNNNDDNGDNNGNENGENSEEKDGSRGKLSLGAIIGIVVGGVVVIGVIIGVTVFCIKKKAKVSNSSDE